jgi:hypothetical protein
LTSINGDCLVEVKPRNENEWLDYMFKNEGVAGRNILDIDGNSDFLLLKTIEKEAEKIYYQLMVIKKPNRY